MTVSNVEPRSRDRAQISIPLRVLSFDLENFESGGFSEDTRTLLVNQSGASIALRNPVIEGDFLRIINLTNYAEADFRVVGAMGTTESGARIWGIECVERRASFWGVGNPPPSTRSGEDAASIQCRACGQRTHRPLSPMEFEVLRSAGVVGLDCDACGKPTYWIDDSPNRPARNFSPEEAVAPTLRERRSSAREEEEKKGEKRTGKRSGLKLTILVRDQAGNQELSKTIDISKLGVGLTLFMKLDVGDTVKIVCPYDSVSTGIEQTAEVCWRSKYYNDDFPRTYGLRFVR